MKRIVLIVFLFAATLAGIAQKKVAFTIDDVPNSKLYQRQGFHNNLLAKIDSLQLPVTIFINEARLFDTDSLVKNVRALSNWARDPLVTLGNHTYSHGMYSTEGLDSFKMDVLKGEYLTREIARQQHKPLQYFRFPYNDLGADSMQHVQSLAFISSLHYINTPFTVHSEDWFVERLYTYYKEHQMQKDAERIGKAFVAKTLEYFQYIDDLVKQQTGREVKHIYLMHDNTLNADYLGELIQALKKKGYQFITLDDAMTDPIYSQTDYYMEQPGISWVYRWIKDRRERERLIGKGPNIHEFEMEMDKLK